jgi:exopolysaccharide biosynthesis polyprenyl glycosylphosphotransferase
MNTFKRQFVLELIRIFDLFVCLLAFMTAVAATHPPLSLDKIEPLVNARISIVNLFMMVVLLGTWHTVFSMAGLYDSRRFLSLGREINRLFAGTFGCAFAMYFVNFLFPMNIVGKHFLVYFSITLFITLVISRLLLRFFLKQLRLRGNNIRYVLIAGTNQKALAFAEKIRSSPELGFNLKGFVDTEWFLPPPSGSPYQIVADFTGLKTYLRDNVVDEVIICLPIHGFYDQIGEMISVCSEQGILVRMKTEFFKLKNSFPKIEYLGSDMLMTYCTGHMRRRMLLFKKVADFTAAFVLLVLFSPVLLLGALAVKLSSPGPVFFVQQRIGFNKRRFKLYKFRTMVTDAEGEMAQLECFNEIKGAAFKMKNDPRITRVGRMLRKLSIDELPQLFNVLKGDMSMVGPRPLPERDFGGFNLDWQRRRFCVKPGITCLWQVSGRNNISFDEWMKMDLTYIDTWSPLLDLKILVKTVPAVLSGHGAS